MALLLLAMSWPFHGPPSDSCSTIFALLLLSSQPFHGPLSDSHSAIFALLPLSTSWPFLSHPLDFHSATFAPPLFHICIVAFKIICQHLDANIFCGPTIGPLHWPPCCWFLFPIMNTDTTNIDILYLDTMIRLPSHS